MVSVLYNEVFVMGGRKRVNKWLSGGKARDGQCIEAKRAAGGREIATWHRSGVSTESVVSAHQLSYESELPSTRLPSCRVPWCHLQLLLPACWETPSGERNSISPSNDVVNWYLIWQLILSWFHCSEQRSCLKGVAVVIFFSRNAGCYCSVKPLSHGQQCPQKKTAALLRVIGCVLDPDEIVSWWNLLTIFNI